MVTLAQSAKAFVAGAIAFVAALAIFLGAPEELVAAALIPVSAFFVYRVPNAQVNDLAGYPPEGG